MLSNNGWFKASYKLILKYGLKTSTLFKKSMASRGEPGYFFWRSTLSVFGKESRYSIAFWSVTKLLSSSVGVPIMAKMTAS
jgi:hypothetical protein